MRTVLIALALSWAPSALAVTQQLTPGVSFSWTFKEPHPFGVSATVAWQVLPLDVGPSVGLFTDIGWQQGGFRVAGGPRLGLVLPSQTTFGNHYVAIGAESEVGATWSSTQGFGLRVGGVVSSAPLGFGASVRYTRIWNFGARAWYDPTLDVSLTVVAIPLTYVTTVP